MYGFSNDIWLKLDILNVLLQDSIFYSSKAIQTQLDYSNVETIKKNCHIINEELKEALDLKEYPIIINQRYGFKLEKDYNAMMHYKNYLFSKDFTYAIYINAFFERKSLNLLADETYVSLSTLNRKVDEINVLLESYDIYLEKWPYLRLRGNESTLRIFMFLSLNFIHGKITNISWIQNSAHYINLARKVNMELNLGLYKHQIEGFALWFYIQEFCIGKNYELSYMPRLNKISAFLEYLPKPNTLTHWNDLEWEFFSLVYSVSNFFSDKSLILIDEQLFKIIMTKESFIEDYQKYFTPLSKKSLSVLLTAQVNQLILSNFINFDNWFVKRIFNLDFDKLSDEFKEISRIFEKTWEDFETHAKKRPTDYDKIYSYVLILSVISLQEYKHSVSFFLRLNVGNIFRKYIKQKIYFLLEQNYEVEFVEDEIWADIILCNVGDYRNIERNAISISPVINQRDIKKIKRAVHDLEISRFETL